jgi:tripartite-type tricarboxylate transporter receptor subunit TctC
LVVTNSLGLLAPAHTPSEIIEQIARATHTALADPAFERQLIELGFEPDLDSNPEQFRRSLEEDIAHWTPIIQALGVKID